MKGHHEKKLGRGLSALLGDSKSKSEGYEIGNQNYQAKQDVVELISVRKIAAGIYQPRRNFNEDELQDLANSIKEHGLIQPITLRKSDDDHYEIVAGERRFRAIKMLGLATVPAIVRKINNHQALELAIIENVQRSDLSLIEEAAGYQQLMNEFSYTQEEVATKTGKSRAHIANILRLLTLPKAVKNMLDEKILSMGHARALITSKDPEALAKKIVEESLTVREAEEMMREEKIEKLRSDSVVLQKETSVKFVNSGEMINLENRLSGILGSKVKINYNQFKNSGKMTIIFDEIEKIYDLAERLSDN